MRKPTQPVRSSRHQERYIKPEVIRIGDVIRVTWKQDDITLSAVGTVAKREHYGSTYTEFSTANGTVLFSRYGTTDLCEVRLSEKVCRVQTITLLESAPELQTPALF